MPRPIQVTPEPPVATPFRLAALLLTATLSAPLALPTASTAAIPRGNWIELQTPHFTVYSNASAGKVEDVAVELDLLRQVLESITAGAPPASERPLTIVLFRNEASMRPYLRSPPARGTQPVWESFSGRVRSYLLLNGTKPVNGLLQWGYNAYARHFMEHRFPKLPYWFRMGLGEFYEMSQIDRKGRVRLGYPHGENGRYLLNYSLIPLPQFFRIGRTSSFFDSQEGRRHYRAQSWLVVHYLMTGAGQGPDKAAAFFDGLRGGLSEEEALRQALDRDLRSFEEELKLYLSKPLIPIQTLGKQQFESLALEPRPMEPSEVAYQLALYLVSAHRPPPVQIVEEHLLPLANEGPRKGDVLATLGQLRRRTGRTGEATALFDRALEEQPSSAASYYFIGDHLREVDPAGRQHTIRSSFEKAVEIDPGFGEAWGRLAESFPASERAESIEAWEKAVELIADQPVLAYNLAVVHLGNDDPAAAREVAERHLSAAEAVQSRQRLLRHIEAKEAELARRRQADLYNEAVRLYNIQEFESCREVLKELLSFGDDPRLRSRAQSLAEELDRKSLPDG